MADKVIYQFVDLKIIDGALNGLAAAGFWFGNLLRNKFDLPLVNGAGDNLAGATKGLSSRMSIRQIGKVQRNMQLAIGGILAIGLVLLIVFIAS